MLDAIACLLVAVIRRRTLDSPPDSVFQSAASGNVDVDLLGLRTFRLGERDVEHAVLVAGGDFVGIDLTGQRHGTREGSVTAFGEVVVAIFLFAARPLLTAQDEPLLPQFDGEVVLVQTG